MTQLDDFLGYAESNRLVVCGLAAILIVVVAWADWVLADISVGFLYLFPILLSAAALKTTHIVMLAVVCGYLREAFDPLQNSLNGPAWKLLTALDPLRWPPGSGSRLLVCSAGFAMTGLFVGELNHRRRMLQDHLRERENQIELRRETERRLRAVIETSPLAILTLNAAGLVELANESARQILAFDDEPLQGQEVEPYFPILNRMLRSHRGGGNIRTNVECMAQRRNGEIFLAHVWLSTYKASGGAGLAAVIWDASENLRDREGAGLDSMMATSRVLVGALSHEVRNLASAAAAAHAATAAGTSAFQTESYEALGTLIGGLEKIASRGLQMASGGERAVADLGTVLDEARIVIEPALRDEEITLIWEVSDALPLVQADHHSLLQAFLNLARNSRQALEGCRNRELRISATVERDLVVVRFRDTGPGVKHPDELFRPFQPGARHSGLGLYISRAILRAHGGGLSYEPQSAGSCFAVELWPVENIEGV